jgi:hypothetical protein
MDAERRLVGRHAFVAASVGLLLFQLIFAKISLGFRLSAGAANLHCQTRRSSLVLAATAAAVVDCSVVKTQEALRTLVRCCGRERGRRAVTWIFEVTSLDTYGLSVACGL